jgi:hypothetical protein
VRLYADFNNEFLADIHEFPKISAKKSARLCGKIRETLREPLKPKICETLRKNLRKSA